ncbi:hypothetical protein Ddc_15610 [Ditylenchus destructor]|nr:hypothetical protein Ddc_15610 [Ditylenchus destructor]
MASLPSNVLQGVLAYLQRIELCRLNDINRKFRGNIDACFPTAPYLEVKHFRYTCNVIEWYSDEAIRGKITSRQTDMIIRSLFRIPYVRILRCEIVGTTLKSQNFMQLIRSSGHIWRDAILVVTLSAAQVRKIDQDFLQAIDTAQGLRINWPGALRHLQYFLKEKRNVFIIEDKSAYAMEDYSLAVRRIADYIVLPTTSKRVVGIGAQIPYEIIDEAFAYVAQKHAAQPVSHSAMLLFRDKKILLTIKHGRLGLGLL